MYNIINAQIFTQQTADTVYSVVGNVWKSWNPPPWTWLHRVHHHSHPTDTIINTLNNVIIMSTTKKFVTLFQWNINVY